MKALHCARTALGVALILIAVTAGADCNSALMNVGQPGQTPNRVAGPIAFGNALLASTKIEPASSNAIFVQLYDENFTPRSNEVRAATASLNGAIALVWNGSEFALFYQTPQYQLLMQRIGTNGALIGGPIALLTTHQAGPGQEFDITWDATRNTYDILHSYNSYPANGLWLTLVNRDGSTAFERLVSLFVGIPATPRLAVTANGRIGILWVLRDLDMNESLYFALFGSDNQQITALQLSAKGRQPRIATDGSSFLVAIQVELSRSSSEMRTIRLDNNARVTQPETLLLPTPGADIAPLALMWNPTLGEYALAYASWQAPFQAIDPDVRLRRIPAGAQPVSDTTLSPSSDFHRYQTVHYPLVWTGSAYIAVTDRQVNNAPFDSSLLRHCPLLVNAAVDRAIIETYTGVARLTADASGGTAGYAYTWDFGDTSPTANGRSVTHSYSRNGTYVVTVTVTDQAGAIRTASTIVHVATPRRRIAR